MNTNTRKRSKNWIRREKRLAIYLRGGMACVYCGKGIEDGVTLSLEHVTPFSAGGSNGHTNLVPACRECNSARGTKELGEFLSQAATNERPAGVIATAIATQLSTGLSRYMTIANELIATRGSYGEAMAEMQGI